MGTRFSILGDEPSVFPDATAEPDGQVLTTLGGVWIAEPPAAAINTSWQALPDTGWTAAGDASASIAAGIVSFSIDAGQSSARLRRTSPSSPHMPAVEFVARVQSTVVDGINTYGLGLTNEDHTRGAYAVVDNFDNVTLYVNVSGSWTSGAFANAAGGFAGGVFIRMVATPLYLHFYFALGAGPTPPTSWTYIGSYDMGSAAPDFSTVLAAGLTDLVVLAGRTGGTGTNTGTATNLYTRSLLGAPT